MRLLVLVGFILGFELLNLIYTPILYAADFATTYDTLYKVNQDGSVDVIQDIKLTNLTAQYYSNQYIQDLSTIKIDNLKTYDKGGTIPSKVIDLATSSAIQVSFSNQVVGKNSSRSFSIAYTTKDLTEKQGNTWNVTLPRVNSDTLTEYNATVSVPQSFGAAVSVYPSQKEVKNDTKNNRVNYIFDTKQITTSGITLNFGVKQIYSLGLVYNLKNTKNESVFIEIALPMNTSHQTIQIDSLSPLPESVTADQDGNYIARYKLKPKQEEEVIFSGKAEVHSKPVNTFPQLTETEKQLYTRPLKYWESDNVKIASLAASLQSPENIYRFVVEHLQYQTSVDTKIAVQRKGAIKAFNNPSDSLSMDFNDLFIAIARAAGIPAREVNGYAYTDDKLLRPVDLSKDVLHVWPEYWDQQRGWTQVDPTWENTTGGVDYFNVFDLNHIAFVRKGVNSETPYPAGSYKNKESRSRSVLVSFTEDELALNQNFKVQNKIPERIVAGSKYNGSVIIENDGNTAIYDNIVIKSGQNRQSRQNFIIIPPFSKQEIKTPELKTSFLEDRIMTTELIFKNSRRQFKTQIIPFYKYTLTYIGLLYLTGIPVLAVITYHLLHKKYESKNHKI